jgi:hypothetical protein
VLVEPINSANESDVQVAEGRLGDCELDVASGQIRLDRIDALRGRLAAGDVRIGRLTRGQAELTNAAGGIEVGISEGTAAWVDAESTKGVVHNSLPAREVAGESKNQVKVYARTRLDDIVIHRAAN